MKAATQEGKRSLYDQLVSISPNTVDISPNDTKRIIRQIEVLLSDKADEPVAGFNAKCNLNTHSRTQ